MGPNTSSPEPNFDLPSPETVRGTVDKSVNAPEVSSLPPAELKGMQAELPQTSPPQTNTTNPLNNPILQGLPLTNNPITPVSPTTPQIITTPAIADDVDLIEKEWVLRAKDIVNKTRHDPHEQNKEMSKFKAEYIKKRYNKDLKISDE